MPIKFPLILLLLLPLAACSPTEIDIQATVVSMSADGLVVDVTAMPDGEVIVFDRTVPISSDGHAQLTLDLARDIPQNLQDARFITIEARKEEFLSNTFGTLELELPMTPAEALALPDPNTAEKPFLRLISSNAKRTLGASGDLGEGRLEITPEATLTVDLRGTPGAKVRFGDDTLATLDDQGHGTLTLPSEAVLGLWKLGEMNSMSGPKKTLELTLEVDGAAAQNLTVELTPAYDLRAILTEQLRASLAKGEGLPASDGAGPEGPPQIVFLPPHNTTLRVVGRDGALADAQFIAVATEASREQSGTCVSRRRVERHENGTLREELPRGVVELGPGDTIPVKLRTIHVAWTVELRDAHTLEPIASETFPSAKRCPESTVRRENDFVDTLPDPANIDTWLLEHATQAP